MFFLEQLHHGFHTSLGMRMALVMSGVAAATATLLATLSFLVSQHLIEANNRIAFGLQAEVFGRQIDFEAKALERMITTMSRNAFISNALVDSLGRDQYLLPYLRDQAFPGGWKGELWLLDFEGKPITGNSSHFEFDHRDTAAVRNALSGGDFQVTVAHEHALLLAAPVVFPPTGSVEGAVVAVVDFDEILAGLAGLAAKDNCLVLRIGRQELPIPAGCRVTSKVPAITNQLSLPASFQHLNAEILLYVDQGAVSAAIRNLALAYLLVVGAVILIVLRVSQRMSGRIVEPLVRLTNTADNIANQGRLDLRVPEAGGHETGRLASAFNKMVDSLQTTQARLTTDIARRERLEEALRASEEKYRLLIENQTDLIVKFDLEKRFLFVSPSYCQVFGKTEAELLGNTFRPVVNDEDRPLTAKAMEDLFRPPHRAYHEQRVQTSTGWRWFGWADTAVMDENGQVVAVVGVGRDITEHKQAEEALFNAKERAQVTLHSIGDAVITTDGQAIVDYLNPVAEMLTGWGRVEAVGQPLQAVFRVIHEQTRQPTPDPVVQCLREGKVVALANHSLLLGRHGQEYAIDDSAAPIRGHSGQILGAVLVFHDITETRRLTRQLEHDATHDALTGLVNRREFERRLGRALATAQGHRGEHALCYLDLDQFKVVNDTAGHAAGDELLRQLRTLLSRMFRERDTLARIGGDEFGLLIDNCPLDRAQVIAQTVVSRIRDYVFHWEDRSYQIGVSIGLVPITAQAQDTAQLLTAADVACYTAKELGRNRVHVYQSDDSATSQRHSEILGAAGLRDALEQGRFRLHYQPIVALDGFDRRPVRYEALLRVVHASGAEESTELVLPSSFIPAAERFGMMGAIDRWVIGTAFASYAEGIGRTRAQISINLSGNSLSDETLLDFIEAQFATHDFPPEQVCFEITETAAIHNLSQAVELMGKLKDRGSQLALDDFGSGLSSFHYLKTLPVDYLKIDGSFIKDMIDSPRDRALVAAINRMSHTMGLKTVGEYVHSWPIVEHLRDMGVDYAQGYILGKPAPWNGKASQV
ncbi:MAG: EAL domain-containing protein [Candidatus Accumulibacter sp.]|nr:EAL domain-containing protein [Accumulibacter sp.]